MHHHHHHHTRIKMLLPTILCALIVIIAHSNSSGGSNTNLSFFVQAQTPTQQQQWTCYGLNSTDPLVCHGHGTCVSQDQCTCQAGYTANADCGRWFCYGWGNTDSGVCGSRGDCVSTDNCQCHNGWYGTQCGSSYSCNGWPANWGCNPTQYQNIQPPPSGPDATFYYHGNCTLSGTCSCFPYWQGTSCQTAAYTCNGLTIYETPNVCDGGQCIAQDTCVCPYPYTTGSIPGRCNQRMQCYGKDAYALPVPQGTSNPACGGQGVCNADGTCTCSQGFFGDECQYSWRCENKYSYDPTACNGHGICNDTTSAPTDSNFYKLGTCKCDDRWSGASCEIYENMCYGVPSFDPSVCNGHGSCVNNTCVCDAGYRPTPGFSGTDCHDAYSCMAYPVY
jgi:Notch-like protein